MTARYYARKPLRIAVVQWTGDNEDEMRRFLGALFSFGDSAQLDGGAAVLVSATQRWTPLPLMACVALGPGSAVSIMDEVELRLDYQAVA